MASVFQKLFGLGAVLDFQTGAATQNMGVAERAAGALRKGVLDVGTAARQGAGGLGQFALATLPLYAALGLGVKRAADFETGMARIGTLTDDAGLKQLPQLGRDIDGMSRRFGLAADVLQNATFQAMSANVPLERAAGFLDVASRAAVGGFTDVSVTVDGLTNVLNAYGLGVEQAEAVSDAFFVANRRGKTTVGELAGSLGQVAPIANQLGAGYRDLTAAIATVTKSGVATTEVVTGLKGAFTGIIKPTAEAQKEAARLGLAFGPEAIKAAGGFLPFLQQVKERTGGSLESMGKLFGSVEGLNTILSLTTENGLADFQAGLEEMASGGQTQRNFELVERTAGHQFARLQQSALSMLRGLGAAILPALNEVLGPISEALTDLLDSESFTTTLKQVAADAGAFVRGVVLPAIAQVRAWFEGLSTDTRVKLGKAVVAIGALGGAIAGIAAVVGPVFFGASGLISAAQGAGTAVAAIFSPTVIAALAAGLVLAVGIAESWDKLSSAGAQFGEGFKGKVDAITLATQKELIPSLERARDAVRSMFRQISGEGDKASARWGELGRQVGGLVEILIGVGSIVVDVFSGLLNYLSDGFFAPFATSITEFLGGILDVFEGKYYEGLKRVARGMLGSLLLPVQGFVRVVLQALDTAWQQVVKFANGLSKAGIQINLDAFPLSPKLGLDFLDSLYGPMKNPAFTPQGFNTGIPGQQAAEAAQRAGNPAPAAAAGSAEQPKGIVAEIKEGIQGAMQGVAGAVEKAMTAASGPKELSIDGRKVGQAIGAGLARQNARGAGGGQLLDPSQRARLLRGTLIESVG